MPPETNDPDVKVIALLVVHGSNFSKLHKVDFFLYFPDENKAKNASEKIKQKYPDFSIVIEPVAENSRYLCKIEAMLIPVLDKMRDIREFFTQIAKNFDGEYDGWGAEIVK